MNIDPWLSKQAVDFLDSIINEDTTIFEWGSGGSTLRYAPIAKSIVSIENDKTWYEKLLAEFKERKIDNVDLKFIPNDNQTSKNTLDLNAYSSNSLYFKHKVFKTYVTEIDNHDVFDLVIVDGRSRASCIKHAIDKVKIGGFIMLDDSERAYYNPGKDLLKNEKWEEIVLPGKGGGTTTFYKKL